MKRTIAEIVGGLAGTALLAASVTFYFRRRRRAMRRKNIEVFASLAIEPALNGDRNNLDISGEVHTLANSELS